MRIYRSFATDVIAAMPTTKGEDKREPGNEVGMTIDKIILISFIAPVIQHGRQGL